MKAGTFDPFDPILINEFLRSFKFACDTSGKTLGSSNVALCFLHEEVGLLHAT